MAQVVERAKRLGMTPQGYLKHLVDEDLATSSRAKKTAFAGLFGPGVQIDEAEVDRAIDAAREDYHQTKSRKG